MAKLVISKITDGLGNQLFQYAVGRAVAEYHRTDLLLDITWFDAIEDRFTQRPFLLDRFHIRAGIATVRQVQQLKAPTLPPVVRSIYYRWQQFRPYFRRRYYKEPHFHFDPHIWKSPSTVYLQGFWQSYRYFEGIRGVLLQELKPKNPFGNDAIAWEQDVENTANAVSLHIRRGDFLKADSEHLVLPLGYYEKAISYLQEQLYDPIFFVFSDDVLWAQKHLSGGQFKWVHLPASSPEEELIIMSKCQHHIIANSTFSWWGAWLNPSKQKQVIAPKQWFANGRRDIKDVLPNDWIKI